MTPEQLKLTLEAILMAADEPLTSKRLNQMLVDTQDEESEIEIEISLINKALLELQEDYEKRSLELLETASGYSFRVKKDYAKWVVKLWELKPPRYSRALMETLALIAYKQPITRAEIEQVRGVAVSSHIVKTLMERDWIKIVGHKDLPGKPALLATTKIFLDYFNLKSLTDLPSLQELIDIDKMGEQLEIPLDNSDESPAQEVDESMADTNENGQVPTIINECEGQAADLKLELEEETSQDSKSITKIAFEMGSNGELAIETQIQDYDQTDQELEENEEQTEKKPEIMLE